MSPLNLLSLDHHVRMAAETAVSSARVMYGSRYRHRMPLAKSKKGPCLVLGNGPTLGPDLDLYPTELLRSMPTYVVNNFALSDLCARIQPKNYVLLDPAFWLGSDSSSHLSHRIVDALVTSEWPIDLHIPREAMQTDVWKTQRSRVPQHIHIVPYNRTPFLGFLPVAHWVYRHGLGMPPPQNVLVATVFLALQAGYSPINLLGADHSWHEELTVQDNNEVVVTERHFYDSASAVARPVVPARSQKAFLLHELFFAWGTAFRSYHLLRQYADSIGATVVNVSSHSYVDAFSRSPRIVC